MWRRDGWELPCIACGWSVECSRPGGVCGLVTAQPHRSGWDSWNAELFRAAASGSCIAQFLAPAALPQFSPVACGAGVVSELPVSSHCRWKREERAGYVSGTNWLTPLVVCALPRRCCWAVVTAACHQPLAPQLACTVAAMPRPASVRPCVASVGAQRGGKLSRHTQQGTPCGSAQSKGTRGMHHTAGTFLSPVT